MLHPTTLRRLRWLPGALPLLLAFSAPPAPVVLATVPAADTIPRPVQAPQPFTPAMVALGDAIFHGRTGNGLCYVCHGRNARGTPKGPDLTDSTWLHVDGSYESLVTLIATGVRQSVAHSNPMLPGGGTEPNPEQVRALAAYVYTLSHRTQ